MSVIVLDDGPVGGGETGRTTAHIVNALDDRYEELARLHGRKKTTLAAESHTAAIDFIEETCRNERIDCGFERVDGYLFLGPEHDNDSLEKELAALHAAGLSQTAYQRSSPLPWIDLAPCIRFPHQGQFSPLPYLEGLARAIEQRGGRIFTGTHVSGLEGGKNASVTTDSGCTVRAGSLVVATNAPINDTFPTYAKQAAYRTFVIGCEIPRGSVPKMLLWDTANPYHYVRIFQDPTAKTDILIVGGEDHKTGQNNDAPLRYQRLETWTKHRFPMMGDVRYRWSGQVMEPTDGLAMIGHNPMDDDNVFIVTGHSGNGMTYGTIAGMLIPDLIMGIRNPWEDVYAPARFPHNVKEFMRENMNVAACFTERFRSGSTHTALTIPLDSGTVLGRGTKSIAAYRDEHGNIHERSAVCPHRGCLVHWNSGEKSWDCPCHGSRFDKFGRVINGPCIMDLKPAP